MFFLTLIAAFDPINGDLFNTLYYTYSSKLYDLIIKIVENSEDAEDVLQDTYRKVYQSIKRFYDLDEDSTVKLLVVYARNTALDFLRKKNRSCKTVALAFEESDDENIFEISDNTGLPEDILLNKELAETVALYVGSLSEIHKEVIMLKYKYGMGNKEISNVLRISETAVSSRLDRAKIALRKKMGSEFYEYTC